MGWMIEELSVNFWEGQEILLFSTISRLDLGLTQPPTEIHVVPHLTSEAIPLLSYISSWHGDQLKSKVILPFKGPSVEQASNSVVHMCTLA
jgi:hypothetical protein